MKLHELTYTPGAKKTAKRVGRGPGSGLGKTSGKGEKGQNSRSGGGTRLGFEGGQLPIYRRIPKRGFNNVNTIKYAVVNLEDLNVFEDGTVVTPTLLVEKGIVRKELHGVKVLARGELSKKLTVKAHKFSQTASEAIVKLGGKAEVI
jgi:large subunit ribosomal protein L15